MNNQNFRDWIGRMLSLGVPHEQLPLLQPSSDVNSLRHEAWVRRVLKEAQKNHHDLSTPLADITFLILDTETTGFKPHEGDQIISIAAAKTLNGKIIDMYSSLINPERDIPPTISELTGIYNRDVEHAPLLEQEIKSILSYIENDVILGYHINHDISFLNYFLLKNYRSKLKQQTLELRQLSEAINSRSFPSLDDALSHYSINCTERHTATGDVNLMVQLWQNLLKQFSVNNIVTLHDLYFFLSTRKSVN